MTQDLHPAHFLADSGEDYWWACSEPERPGDAHTIYSEHCPWCVAKFRIDVTLIPDLLTKIAAEHMTWHGADHHDCAIADLLAQA